MVMVTPEHILINQFSHFKVFMDIYVRDNYWFTDLFLLENLQVACNFH